MTTSGATATRRVLVLAPFASTSVSLLMTKLSVWSPAFTATSVISPSFSACSAVSIFIASMESSTSPALTF